MQVKPVTENQVLAEAKHLCSEDRAAGMRQLEEERAEAQGPAETLPAWEDLPAHHQAVYVRVAARGMGMAIPELEVA